MSDFFLLPTRLLCPWNSLGKNIGVGSHSLLQGIFLNQRRKPSPLTKAIGFTLCPWDAGNRDLRKEEEVPSNCLFFPIAFTSLLFLSIQVEPKQQLNRIIITIVIVIKARVMLNTLSDESTFSRRPWPVTTAPERSTQEGATKQLRHRCVPET